MISHLSRNSLWLLLARLGTQLGLALFTILLARQLGSALFGEYAFMAAVLVIGNVVTTFGTDMLLIRDIAATDDLAPLSAALIIQLGASAIFIGLVIVASFFTSNESPGSAQALRIFSLSLIPLAFYTVFTTALRGKQCMASYTVLNLVLVAMQLGAAFWLRWRGGGLIFLATLLVLVQIIAAVLAGVISGLRIPGLSQIWRFTSLRTWTLIKASAPLALLSLLGILYQRLSLLLLPQIAGATVTGWFSAGARVVEAAKVAHVAVFTALYPMMAQAHALDSYRWSLNFRLPRLLLLVAAVVGSLGLSFLAGQLIAILYGSGYAPSASILRVLAWMLIPYTINTYLGLAFLTSGKQAVVVEALSVSICILMILTIWWEPQVGPVGAAWGALSAELTQSVILLMHERSQHFTI